MAKRMLMVITPETPGDLRSAARSAAVVARDSGRPDPHGLRPPDPASTDGPPRSARRRRSGLTNKRIGSKRTLWCAPDLAPLIATTTTLSGPCTPKPAPHPQ